MYAPCSDATRIGTMTVSVVPKTSTGGGYSEFNGGIYDSVDPRNVWTEKTKEGDCRLITGPKSMCAPACTSGQVCSLTTKQCVAEPEPQDAGTVSVAGLSAAFSAEYRAGVYYKPITGAFPPAAAGADVTMSAAGAKVPAFSITASGIDPLQVPEGDITLDTSKPLTITWTPPTKAGTSHVVVSLDLAHHGNVAAKLVCDVADTGSTTIPVSLLTALAAEGVAGFPSVAIVRRALNSATVGSGCVEFGVSSSLERPLVLPGVMSCMCPNDTCEPCAAAGLTCKANYTCG